MRGEDRGLADVAASVADGDAIDWQAAESTIPQPQRSLIRQLRLVETISRVYRTLPEHSEADWRSTPTDPIGQHWGHLILLEQIGHGTSCEVYRALDTELHRDVALKLLHNDSAASTSAHRRVMDEARRLARVEHPNIVRVYGAEQHDGRVGLWMELVRGQSLEEIVRTGGRFSPAEAALIGRQMCAALAAVHGAGLLHRDVKAQNVMRDATGRTVLMDFGTGELLRDNTGSNRFVGTPLYLAPEIFEGRPATPQSDIYSLGVMLFYLVTGEHPQAATTMEQLADAHGRRDTRRLMDLRPELPRQLASAIERALDRNPEQRYRTAAEMETALQSIPETGTASRSVPEAAPRWWPFAAAVAALLVLAVALIVWSRRPSGIVDGDIQTVAVAPMTTIDASAVPPFFAEGLTDQLISTLGQIRSLRVKSSPVGVPATATESASAASSAAVDAILQTTVLVAGGAGDAKARVRVNARLIAAGSNTVIWADTFEQALGDTFALQAAIARKIAAAVNAAITPAEELRLNRSRQTTAAAEAAYLEGRAYIGRYPINDTRRALEAFQRAMQADPNHAGAYAGAARAHFTLGFANVISQPVARTLALAEAQKALDLDDTLPEAHATLADMSFYYDWNWQGAEERYIRSLELNQSYLYGRTQYAQLLAAARRGAEAVSQSELVVGLQPTSADAHRTHGLMLYYHRDFPAADVAIRRSLEFDPNAPGSWLILGRIAEAEGRLDEARRDTDRAVDLSRGDGVPALLRIQHMRLQALTGQAAEARAALQAFRRESDDRGILWNPQFDAYVQLALGEREQALAFFEAAMEQRQPSLLWLAVDPRLDPVRNHPRFLGIIRRLGPN